MGFEWMKLVVTGFFWSGTTAAAQYLSVKPSQPPRLPPSPAAADQPSPRLTFYAGVINVGDYLTARGDYNVETQTLTVALADDYIETFAQKP